jgi:16S rRNA (cytosine967-C5)-methyltransferase
MAAYRILCRLGRSHIFAVNLLHGSMAANLKETDRNLAVELVMGVLRWRGELDYQIQRLSGRPLEYFEPEVVEALRLGVYQIRFLSRIPKAAAVNESVELVKAARKRSAAALTNAVLRKCEPADFRLGNPRIAKPHPEYLKCALRSMPQWIWERWVKNFGLETATAILLASQAVPFAHLRLTGGDDSAERVQGDLDREQVRTRPGVYTPKALRVESGNVFITEPWRQGRVVAQEEASQLVAHLADPQPAQNLLDLCAAPGVKSRQYAERLNGGVLIACDRSLRRIETMESALLSPWPHHAPVQRVVLDASKSLPFRVRFERVAADVPCSGTGTLARNPEIKWRLRPVDLARLAEMQANILRNGLQALAPGGRLVYSTCSLEPEENDRVVSEVVSGIPQCRLMTGGELSREFPEMAALFENTGYFRTLPGIHPVDGFFAAVIARD